MHEGVLKHDEGKTGGFQASAAWPMAWWELTHSYNHYLPQKISLSLSLNFDPSSVCIVFRRMQSLEYLMLERWRLLQTSDHVHHHHRHLRTQSNMAGTARRGEAALAASNELCRWTTGIVALW
jgi:hypothetical protein